MKFWINKAKNKIFMDFVCPECGACEGPVELGQSLLCYCPVHRLKWVGGWDETIEVDEEEQEREYNEVLGLGDFTRIDSSGEGFFDEWN
jgi:hypothetical protein